MVEFRVLDSDNNKESRVVDFSVTDAFNRFAREANLEIVDFTGDLRKKYTKYSKMTIEWREDSDSSWKTLFGGFVINSESDEDTLKVRLLSHDHWLRRRDVFASYSSTQKDTILKDLITTYTPLTWDASLVNVQDNTAISRTWEGERLVNIIEEISSASQDEEYGANDDLKFFFREQGSTASPVKFTRDQVIDYQVEEDSQREVNRVVVYYGKDTNTGSVALQDLESQNDIQNELGADRPVVIERRKAFPEISSDAEAERKARSILNQRDTIQVVKVFTQGALNIDPGDVAPVEIPQEGIDSDYRVAEIKYEGYDNRATLTMAENVGDITDLLVEYTDEIKRIDLRDADDTADRLEVVELLSEFEDDFEFVARSRSVKDDAFVFGEFGGNLGHPDQGGGFIGNRMTGWSENAWPEKAIATSTTTSTYTEAGDSGLMDYYRNTDGSLNGNLIWWWDTLNLWNTRSDLSDGDTVDRWTDAWQGAKLEPTGTSPTIHAPDSTLDVPYLQFSGEPMRTSEKLSTVLDNNNDLSIFVAGITDTTNDDLGAITGMDAGSGDDAFHHAYYDSGNDRQAERMTVGGNTAEYSFAHWSSAKLVDGNSYPKVALGAMDSGTLKIHWDDSSKDASTSSTTPSLDDFLYVGGNNTTTSDNVGGMKITGVAVYSGSFQDGDADIDLIMDKLRGESHIY